MIIIRSQDKTFLGKCSRLVVGRTESCLNNEYSVLEQTGCDSYIELGIYKSKERAIEVLDRIHSQITRDVSRDYISNGYKINQNYVLEMPSE